MQIKQSHPKNTLGEIWIQNASILILLSNNFLHVWKGAVSIATFGMSCNLRMCENLILRKSNRNNYKLK